MRIRFAEHGDSARDRRLNELDLAAEADCDQLTDDDAKTPSSEDGIKRAVVDWSNHQPLDDGADNRPEKEGHGIGEPRIEAQPGHNEG